MCKSEDSIIKYSKLLRLGFSSKANIQAALDKHTFNSNCPEETGF